jgi:peptide subunit release factor 1 (eRF1)
MLTPNRYKLSKTSTLHFLDEVKKSLHEVTTLYLPPGSPKNNSAGMLETFIEPANTPDKLKEYIEESPTGSIIIWGAQDRYLILPPFPIQKEQLFHHFEGRPLIALLEADILLALVLVRLGSYGIGVYRGEGLLDSKVGTGLVHARHRQGGSSSHRFERHRYKQMEAFFTRVGLHAREKLEPYLKSINYLIYGGQRETLLEFRKQTDFLHAFDARTLDLILNVRDPNQAGLDEAIREAWSCRVIRWEE